MLNFFLKELRKLYDTYGEAGLDPNFQPGGSPGGGPGAPFFFHRGADGGQMFFFTSEGGGNPFEGYLLCVNVL